MNVRKLMQLLALNVLLLFAGSVQAQDRTVTGRVTDSVGTGVPGVSVTVKGQSSRGVTTTTDGSFSILVPANATSLVFSSVGYETQEMSISGLSSVNVSLQSSAFSLNEVVVVGYGTQRRRDVTGSITKLGEEDLNPGAITNPLQQIAGKAAGVTITQVGSEPGVGPIIRIRGITSLSGGNDPLVVVDGMQGNLDLLNQVPPSEIESVDILKDASATAIYGSRGAAGVVIVTTKKGRAGRTTLEYSGTYSTESVAKKFDILDGPEYRAASTARGLTLTDYGANTDWFDLITRNGNTQNHNVAFGGGASNFTYRASLTAILQEGLIMQSGFKNYIGRFQGTQKALDDKLTIGINLNSSIISNRWNSAGNNLGNALSRRPTDPVYFQKVGGGDSTAYFIDPTSFSYVNPFARAKEMIDGSEQNSLFGSLRTDFEIVDGLTAGFFGSWRKVANSYGSYASPRTTREDARNYSGIASRGQNNTNERLMDLSLNYKKNVGDHNIDVIGVYEWQKAIYDGFGANGRGFINDFLTYNSLQSSDVTKAFAGDVNSYKNDRTIISFVGRVNYGFRNKYYLTASLRRDGSSVFGANHKWGNFPSASLAWRITGEEFMNDLDVVNDLKLRVGYGVTGNQQGLAPQGSLQLVGQSGTTFFGGSLIPNFAISQNANADLRWETKKMANAGLDFSLLENRLSGSVDVYSGKTENLLFNYTVPIGPQFQFNSVLANVGTINNKGLEVSLDYNLIRRSDLSVTLAGNFTTNKNTVEKLSGTVNVNGIPTKLDRNYVGWGSGGTTGVAGTNNGISYLIEGMPIGSFWLFKHVGVDAYGKQIFSDLNKDGVLDEGDISGGSPNRDRMVFGQALPKFTYAFTPNMTFKNFDLSMVWRGVYGNKIYNARRATLSALSNVGVANVLRSALNDNIENIDRTSDYWLEDGSYLRFENLNLGYRFNLSNVRYISGIRASVTASNIAVFTDYSGIDPELSLSGGSGFGVDYGIYPRTRSFAFGLNVIFK